MRRFTVSGLKRRISRARAAAVSGKRAAVEWRRRRGPRSAVDFADWVDRRLYRSAAGYPDGWRNRTDTSFSEPSRLGVLVHVYYPELVAELLAELAAVPVQFDLIVTNATGQPLRLDLTSLPNLRHHVVLDVKNHGRDIWPTVQVVNAGLLDPYEIVLKLHTKRSEWRAGHEELSGTGEQWRTALIDSLLGQQAAADD